MAQSPTRNSETPYQEDGNGYGMLLKISLHFWIALYRSIGTAWLGGMCRFEPSCSAYAEEALRTKSTHVAISLIVKRLIRCHPFGSFGYDPVPDSVKEQL